MNTYPIYRVDEITKPGLYLCLFHGFKDEESRKQAGDWGENGPMIGPLEYVHTTYAFHIKFSFSNDEDYIKYGFSSPESELFTSGENGDCIYFNDMYYGDWTVFYKN